MTHNRQAPTLHEQACRAYQALLSFCSWALLATPDRDALAGLAGEEGLFEQDPFSTVAPEEGAELGRLVRAAATADEGGEELLRQIGLDRTYLFLMVGQSHASPYESVYRTEDRTMMGPTTLEVRETYRAWGLDSGRSASEPDDHLGLELSFAAHLLGLGAQGDAAALDTLHSFVEGHILQFAPIYLQVLGQRARTGYYRAVAGLSLRAIESLAEALGAGRGETDA